MVTRVDKFLGGLGKDVTNIANVHATENRITFGGLENPSANAHIVGTVLASTNAIVGAEIVTSGHTLDVRGTANTGALTTTGITASGALTVTEIIASGALTTTIGLGAAGNTAPTATGISIGTPANATLRTHTASGAANLIIGDATLISPYNLDVRGTANVGALTTTDITIGSASINETELEILDGATLSTTELNYVDGVTSAIQTQLAAHTTEDTALHANDYVTYTRLNANLNVVQDNVDALSGTSLTPASNTITSVSGANAYGIGAAVTVLNRTRVMLSGINQLPTSDYVVPSSGVMQLTEPSANIPAGVPILINYWA